MSLIKSSIWEFFIFCQVKKKKIRKPTLPPQIFTMRKILKIITSVINHHPSRRKSSTGKKTTLENEDLQLSFAPPLPWVRGGHLCSTTMPSGLRLQEHLEDDNVQKV